MVIRHYTTHVACSCADWQYRPRARPCKHVSGIRDAMALLRAQGDHNEGLGTPASFPARGGVGSEGGVNYAHTPLDGSGE